MNQYKSFAEQVGGQQGQGRPPSGADFRQGAESVMRFYEGLARLWSGWLFGMMGGPLAGPWGGSGSGFGGGWGGPGCGPTGGFGGPVGDAAPSESDTAIAIETVGARRIRTALTLAPGARDRPLRVPQLVAEVGIPPIVDVVFEAAAEGRPLTVRITLPEAQPAGGYHGVVLDAMTGAPCGSLSLDMGA